MNNDNRLTKTSYIQKQFSKDIKIPASILRKIKHISFKIERNI